MKSSKIIFPILTLFCMLMIFFFSQQDAQKSQSLSDEVAIKTLEITESVTKKETTQTEKNQFIHNTRTFIRKSAHFTIYFALGICIYLTFKSYQIKHPDVFSILFCFFYACTDEIHQLFVEMRTAQILDVFIDTVGASLGILLFALIFKHREIKKLQKTAKD